MRRRTLTLLALLASALPACAQTPADSGDGSNGTVRLRADVVASGLERPLWLTAPVGDPRLFIVEQPGRVRIVEDGRLLDQPFLDITDRVGSRGNEQGLLGLAFHPDYASNGWFYVDYTDANGDTRVERYAVSASDPDRADASSAKLLLAIDQPYSNHNGGGVAFGPDGYLYVGTGDGGSAGDPAGNAQNTSVLLGKLLRLDVDSGDPYAIPSDNPFAGTAGARGEIWAYGLRNPWRYSWDDGTLYIADVGQNRWEEVDARPADAAGLNYGWDRMEGAHCYEPSSGCDRSGLVIPVVEYSHDAGCSVTGGYVYRGAAIPALRGQYFYSDWCSGWLRSFRLSGGAATDARTWDIGDVGNVTSFGVDAAGELYIVNGGGTVYRVVER